MKTRMWLSAIALALVALALGVRMSQPARAAGPWYVAPDGDNGDPCTSPDAPCATIDAAILKARAGDTIYVAVGTYTDTGSQVVWIDIDLTLSGGWDTSFGVQSGISTIDGENERKGISLAHDVTAVVERFRIQNGWQTSSGSAGGITLYQGTLTLNNCTVTNSGFRGISNDHGTLTLNHSVVADNSDAGIASGGILILNDSTVSGNGFGISHGGTLTLNRTTIESNQGGIRSGLGAAMNMGDSFVRDNAGIGIHSRGVLTLTNSIVSRNSGGGINNDWNGVLVIRDSIVEGNTADKCAGISNSGFLTLTNSTVSRNSAGQDGGGICNDAGLSSRNDDGVVVLNNSTVAANTAGGRGGGIYNNQGSSIDDYGVVVLNNSTLSGNTAKEGGGGVHNGGTITMQNTILAGNTTLSSLAPDCSGVLDSWGSNLVGNSQGCTCVAGTGDLVNVDPQLGHLIGSPSYYPLLPTSPAIDAGDPAGCSDHLGQPLDTDQRGATRLGRCDIGAYEYTVPGPAATIYASAGTPQSTPPLVAFPARLQVLVLDAIGSPANKVTVAFSAPSNGPSARFADSGTHTAAAVTDGHGIASAAILANGQTGNYAVTATVIGVVTPTHFVLSNVGWYVTPGGNDARDCQTPATACASINGVLGKVGFGAGDTVMVASGVYVGTGDEVLLLDESARLLGGWDGTFAAQSGISAIDGDGVRRGIIVNGDVTAVVERFTVQNIGAPGSFFGLAISNEGILTLNSSSVSGNTSTCFTVKNDGHFTANNSTISGNVGKMGCGANAALWNHNAGVMILNSTNISDNAPEGGICNYGTLILNNSSVSDNTGGGWIGGGIGNWGGNLILNSSTVSGNTDRGIHNDSGGSVILNNSTVSGNTANIGGGISNDSGSVILNNSTVSGNAATGHDGGGGGIYNDSGTVTLQNTILAGNTASSAGPNCSGTIESAGHNLIGDVSGCSFSSAAGDQVGTDPEIGLLEGSPGYHPLGPGSPAINAGDPTGCTDHVGNPLPFDQRGMPRVGRCDIGAYEAGLVTTKQLRGTFAPGGLVTYTITMSNEEGITDLVDVLVTDTLPAYHAYVPGSFSATNGLWDESGGTITWTGTVFSSGDTVLSFGAVLSDQTPRDVVLTNTALIESGGVTIARYAIVDTSVRVYLPVVARNYCGPALYADDFSDAGSGWPAGDSGNVLYAYQDGEYQLLLRTQDIWAGTRPGFKASDYAVAVDVRRASGSGLGAFGLLFGLSDNWSQFYSFEIMPHGINTNYFLFRYNSGKWTPLALGFSGSISSAEDATNRLKVVRDGTLIQIYVNGQLLRSVQDSTYTGSKHVGLIASAYDRPNVDTRFDNFIVYPAQCGASITALGWSSPNLSSQTTALELSGAREGTCNRKSK